MKTAVSQVYSILINAEKTKKLISTQTACLNQLKPFLTYQSDEL